MTKLFLLKKQITTSWAEKIIRKVFDFKKRRKNVRLKTGPVLNRYQDCSLTNRGKSLMPFVLNLLNCCTIWHQIRGYIASLFAYLLWQTTWQVFAHYRLRTATSKKNFTTFFFARAPPSRKTKLVQTLLSFDKMLYGIFIKNPTL